ncbi:MAG: Ig-like domain-containing protein [Cyclobacteriaceae bacterium]
MKQTLYGLLIIMVFEIFSSRCANPITPTGGPKDTIPPTLVYSNPVNEEINFKNNEITLQFDEYINADKLKQNLIITPFFESKYKSIIKKTRLILRFEEPFSDSTTYTLNFANGITDITEKTPPDNLSLSFSTGSYIDSLKVIGSIGSLLTGLTPKEKFNISLYKINDSLDFVTQKPTYFTKSLDNGQFELRNIKTGKYILIAFEDKNNNLQLDPTVEPHALFADTLQPAFDPDSINMKFITVDASKLKFISARPSAQYYEIRYSKPITRFSISPFQYARKVSDNQVIRIYQDSINLFDSLQVIVKATDTVNNNSIDTLFVKFQESSRKIEEFKLDHSIKSSSSGTRIVSSSNVPALVSKESFKVKIDTITSLTFPIDSLIHDDEYSNYTIYSPFNQSSYNLAIDSLINYYFRDTTNIDSIGLRQFNYLNAVNRNNFKISILKGAFNSIMNDSSKAEVITGKFYNPENYGTITVNTKTELINYQVRLVDSKQQTIAKMSNCVTCNFYALPPAEYSVRIFVDTDNNNRWSPGNILRLEAPEQIINFQEFTDLRANWAIELNYEF